MCLAIPAKILKIRDSQAIVDFGRGVTREVNIMLVNANLGDYVLVHAGYAITILDEKEAKESIKLWNKILVMDD